jgi:hypothetical protein
VRRPRLLPHLRQRASQVRRHTAEPVKRAQRAAGPIGSGGKHGRKTPATQTWTRDDKVFKLFCVWNDDTLNDDTL